MKKINFTWKLACLVLAGSLFSGCSDQDPPAPQTERSTTDEMYYANLFAGEILQNYYYWNKEVAGDLARLDPNTNTDPIKTVSEIRYHKENTLIDKWTMLTDDMKQFTENVGGVSTTFGYQPVVYRVSDSSNQCIAPVAFVYKDSPAAKAGLKRGDLIYQINGKELSTDNYQELFNSASITLSLATIDPSTKSLKPKGKPVQLTAVKMYENPVLHHCTFEFNGKKVGYLAYSSFDLKSIPELVEISKKFKSEGVQELILDLRYNGGGYVITENAMGSMYAPQAAVSSHEIFEKEDFNEEMTAYFKQHGKDNITRFQTEYSYPQEGLNISTKDANIGLKKIYGIITKNSASASEALLGGLMPYMEVELIGEQSHGKYCTGWMLSAKDAYDKVPPAIQEWGMYVMVSVYKNAADQTPCMPDGMVPNVKAEDDPMQPYQLGDENESMLKVALTRAGKKYPDAPASRSGKTIMEELPTPQKANFGKRILLPPVL